MQNVLLSFFSFSMNTTFIYPQNISRVLNECCEEVYKWGKTHNGEEDFVNNLTIMMENRLKEYISSGKFGRNIIFLDELVWHTQVDDDKFVCVHIERNGDEWNLPCATEVVNEPQIPSPPKDGESWLTVNDNLYHSM